MHSVMSTENPSLAALWIENDVLSFFRGLFAIRFICMVNTCYR